MGVLCTQIIWLISQEENIWLFHCLNGFSSYGHPPQMNRAADILPSPTFCSADNTMNVQVSVARGLNQSLLLVRHVNSSRRYQLCSIVCLLHTSRSWLHSCVAASTTTLALLSSFCSTSTSALAWTSLVRPLDRRLQVSEMSLR